MQEINVIGLDLAKHIFHVYGVNRQGQPVVSRKLRRHQMHSYFRQLPPCLIGMESCATSHYWARAGGARARSEADSSPVCQALCERQQE